MCRNRAVMIYYLKAITTSPVDTNPRERTLLILRRFGWARPQKKNPQHITLTEGMWIDVCMIYFYSRTDGSIHVFKTWLCSNRTYDHMYTTIIHDITANHPDPHTSSPKRTSNKLLSGRDLNLKALASDPVWHCDVCLLDLRKYLAVVVNPGVNTNIWIDFEIRKECFSIRVKQFMASNIMTSNLSDTESGTFTDADPSEVFQHGLFMRSAVAPRFRDSAISETDTESKANSAISGRAWNLSNRRFSTDSLRDASRDVFATRIQPYSIHVRTAKRYRLDTYRFNT